MLPVIYTAAGSDERDFANAILFRSFLVIADLNNLRVPETERQHQQSCGNNESNIADAPAKEF